MPTPIETLAADWLVRSEAGLSSMETLELESWLAVDPAHRRAYERVRAGSQALDRLARFRPRTELDADPDLALPRARLFSRSRNWRAPWIAGSLAAAAAFAI